jgi:hypothetical protein
MAAVDRGPGDAAPWAQAARGDHDAFGQLSDRHAGAALAWSIMERPLPAGGPARERTSVTAWRGTR